MNNQTKQQVRRFPPAAVTAFYLGCAFLIAAIALYIWKPEFTGLTERQANGELIPFWLVLVGLAGLNFVFALLNTFVYRGMLAAESAVKPEASEEQDNA